MTYFITDEGKWKGRYFAGWDAAKASVWSTSIRHAKLMREPDADQTLKILQRRGWSPKKWPMI